MRPWPGVAALVVSPMKSAKAKDLFVAHLSRTGRPLSELRPAAGVAAMISFYKNQRADDCDIDSDGDMIF